MSSLEQEQIAEKIAQCRDALADLERYRSAHSLESLRADSDAYFAVCYRFVSAIESLFDLGAYVLARQGVRAETQREVAILLGREQIVDRELAERFAAMYGFRNRLVHAYGTLSDERVADALANRLEDIRALLMIFENQLSR